jgi:hypothetical protein
MPSNRVIEGTGVADEADAGSDALTLADGGNANRPPNNQAETDRRIVDQLIRIVLSESGTRVGAFSTDPSSLCDQRTHA